MLYQRGIFRGWLLPGLVYGLGAEGLGIDSR